MHHKQYYRREAMQPVNTHDLSCEEDPLSSSPGLSCTEPLRHWGHSAVLCHCTRCMQTSGPPLGRRATGLASTTDASTGTHKIRGNAISLMCFMAVRTSLSHEELVTRRLMRDGKYTQGCRCVSEGHREEASTASRVLFRL